MKFYDNVKQNYPQYLNDESGIISNGHADRIYFPTNEIDIQEIMREAVKMEIPTPVTISGGGTGIAGGRVPLTGWIVATDKMKSISSDDSEKWMDPETKKDYDIKLLEINENKAYLTIPISLNVKAIQNLVQERNWFYPPDTTERSSFIGGNIATNASGARCFKYGSTREWVIEIRVVLPDGSILKLNRDDNKHYLEKDNIVLNANGKDIRIKRPNFKYPDVTKNVAGPVIKDGMHPIDLFIGSNGIFGIVTEVTLVLIRPPNEIISIFAFCGSLEQGIDLIKLCQDQRDKNKFPIPLSVEFLDDRAVKIMQSKDDRIKETTNSIIMIEQDINSENEYEEAINFWNDQFDNHNITDTYFAQGHREIEHHKFLRHCVPEHIISVTKSFNQAIVVTDYSVPKERLRELFYYAIEVGEEFEKLQKEIQNMENETGYVFFAHAGDSHIHLALIPRNKEETRIANSLMIKIMQKIINMGGSISAEHGLGKKKFNNIPAISIQYGNDAIDEIRKMKLVLDPKLLLNPHNLIG